MDKDQATRAFETFEDMRFPDDNDPLPPVFSVRLDATHDNRTDGRDFRVRITPGPYPVPARSWADVTEMARAENWNLRIENNGVELS